LAAAMEAPEHQRDIVHWLMDEAQKVVSAKVRARVASLARAPPCFCLCRVYASAVCQHGAGACQAHVPGAIRKGRMPALQCCISVCVSVECTPSRNDECLWQLMGNKDEVGARGMLESSMTVAMLLMDAETIYNIANLFLAANSPSQVWHSVLMLGEPLSVILGSGTEWVALGGWGWSAGRMTHNTPARNGLRLPCTHTHTYHYSCTRLARTRIRLHAPSYALAERHLSLSLPSLSLSRALSLAVCVYVCVCVCVCVSEYALSWAGGWEIVWGLGAGACRVQDGARAHAYTSVRLPSDWPHLQPHEQAGGGLSGPLHPPASLLSLCLLYLSGTSWRTACSTEGEVSEVSEVSDGQRQNQLARRRAAATAAAVTRRQCNGQLRRRRLPRRLCARVARGGQCHCGAQSQCGMVCLCSSRAIL
jgi:hypothetical protein